MKRLSRHILPFTLGLLALAALAPAQAQWSQHQGDAAHSGYAPGSLPATGVAQQWTWSDPAGVGSGGGGTAVAYTPLAVGDRGVYVCVSEGTSSVPGDSLYYHQWGLSLLNAVTGQAQWTTPVLSYSGTVFAPSLGAGTVYVDVTGEGEAGGSSATEPPFLEGVDAATGQAEFRTQFSGQWSAGSRPTVLGGQVISLGGYYGGMDAYDAAGNHQWFLQLPQQYGFIPAMDATDVYIYYGEAGGSPGPGSSTLYAISRASGAVDYTITNPADTFTTYSSVSSPALGGQNDAIVVGNTGSNGPRQVYSFDLHGRAVRWTRALNAEGCVAVNGGAVYVPQPGQVSALDEATGGTLWTWLAPGGVTLTSNALVTDDTVVVASNYNLYGISRATGQGLWTATLNTPSGQFGPYDLAFYGGHLYVCGAGHVLAFQAADRVWRAVGVSAGADGNTRVLWDRSDGLATVWKVDPQGNLVTQQQYGPYAGWTARAIATGKDNQTRLLWTNTDGTAAYYLLDAGNAYVTQRQYGPYAGWTAQNLAVAPDGTARALWTNQSGAATVWTLDAQEGFAGQRQYGPYAGWTAQNVASAGDGSERLLWTNADGTAALWRLDAGSALVDQRQYAPFPGWTARNIAAAPDGSSRVAWQYSDGHIALWTVDGQNNYAGLNSYGPYSAWGFTALAVGADGNPRMLWNNVSGQSAVWSLTPSGAFASNTQFGPY